MLSCCFALESFGLCGSCPRISFESEGVGGTLKSYACRRSVSLLLKTDNVATWPTNLRVCTPADLKLTRECGDLAKKHRFLESFAGVCKPADLKIRRECGDLPKQHLFPESFARVGKQKHPAGFKICAPACMINAHDSHHQIWTAYRRSRAMSSRSYDIDFERWDHRSIDVLRLMSLEGSTKLTLYWGNGSALMLDHEHKPSCWPIHTFRVAIKAQPGFLERATQGHGCYLNAPYHIFWLVLPVAATTRTSKYKHAQRERTGSCARHSDKPNEIVIAYFEAYT